MLDELTVIEPCQRIDKRLLALNVDVDTGDAERNAGPDQRDAVKHDLQDTAGDDLISASTTYDVFW